MYSSSDHYIHVCTISMAQAAAHKHPKLLPSTAQQLVSQVHHGASSGCPKAVEHWNFGTIEIVVRLQEDISTRCPNLLISLPWIWACMFDEQIKLQADRTRHVDFWGNPLDQATKRHLNNKWWILGKSTSSSYKTTLKQQMVNFWGNPLHQATKRHLNNKRWIFGEIHLIKLQNDT